jgi:hypothetical protein
MCKKVVLFAIILAIIPSVVLAQGSTTSPYTRYGYGKLADKSFAPQRAMGGIGYGLRNSQYINPMNPASISNVDSMTFMLDMGVTGQMGWIEDGPDKSKRINGNLEYIALQFPLLKKMGVSAGLEPVSYVGYKTGDSESIGEDYSIYTAEGSGGLSQIYGALSYAFLDRFSAGVKFAYLFGNVNHQVARSFSVSGSTSTIKRDTIFNNGLTYELGLQYHQEIGKYRSLVLGAVYSPKIAINGKETRVSFPSSGDTYQVLRDSIFEMPETYGFGASYNQLNKLTIGADVTYQKWADARFKDQKNAFNDRLKFNLGGEIIPNLMNNKYYNRVRYRGGLYYSKSYLVASSSADSDSTSGYKEYGVNVGLGLPMPDRRSFVNVALEYSLLSPNVNTFIKEQYFKLTVSYTFNELWFLKRKVQ